MSMPVVLKPGAGQLDGQRQASISQTEDADARRSLENLLSRRAATAESIIVRSNSSQRVPVATERRSRPSPGCEPGQARAKRPANDIAQWRPSARDYDSGLKSYVSLDVSRTRDV